MSPRIENRLEAMGLSLPAAPAPKANYLPWVRLGDVLHVSGQVASTPSGAIWTGKLGANMDVRTGAAAARSCALSLLAQVRAACDGDLDRLVRVIKLTGFVNCTPDFTDQPAVINGASDFLVDLLADTGRHARSAVGVAALPLGAAVEIEAIFQIQ